MGIDRRGRSPEQPLAGRRVVVTRPRSQAKELVEALSALGAEPVVFPTIRIAPPEDPQPLRQATRNVGGYDWVVFTSVNGVDRFWRELEAAGLDARVFAGVRVACIGPATAAAVELEGIRPDLIPAEFVAEAMVDALATTELAGARILLPRAAEARSVLPEGLEARGAAVDEVEAYRAVPDAEGAADLRRRLDSGEVDAITFTASSTVKNFVAAVGRDVGSAAVAAIGPVTAETARACGIGVDVVAREYTIPGLIRALVGHFERSAPTGTG